MKKIFLTIFLCLIINTNTYAAPPYSNASILLYNDGVRLQQAKNYVQAEQKYLQALKLQPNFKEAKGNLIILYRRRAYDYYMEKDFNNSLVYAKKALSSQPNDISINYIIAESYKSLNDTNNAISSYNAILKIKPNEESALSNLASMYYNSGKYANAVDCYKKILLIDPDNKFAKNNLEVTLYRLNSSDLQKSFENLQITHTAPDKLYKLIKLDAGVSPRVLETTRNVLDLVWSEPSGRIYLQALMDNKIPIRIIKAGDDVNANAEEIRETQTYNVYGIPLSYTSKTVSVNIPVKYVNDFSNTNLSPDARMYNLHVFIHEFGHAFISIKEKNHKNSLEEELGVSMIGYNIANYVVTGKYLTREQVKIHSKGCLKSLLSDEHKNLPIYSGFNNTIQKYGIVLPESDIYSNLTAIYKNLIIDKEIMPVSKFYQYL